MNRHGKPKTDSMCPKVVKSEKNLENQNASKSEEAPGTNKTYAEAVKNRAILLQQTVENLVKTMSKVMIRRKQLIMRMKTRTQIYHFLDSYTNLPFFNKSESTFTPPPGRDIYLDFYITAVTEELSHSEQKGKHYSNISKNELESLRKLSQDQSIVIKKADKSNTTVIMNTDDYRKEVLRQLDNVTYYETLSDDPTHIIKKKISECIETL